ncbi:wax ester/triacylglycerol synthase family O-acyltransferase [soil metagenome]
MSAGFAISSADAFHLGVANNHVGCLWLLDTMPAQGALEACSERLARANPRMRASYRHEENCWRELPEFDPAGQVVHAPPSLDMAAMLARLASFYVEPLLEGRPPWRAILLPIEGQGPALCFLAHHAFTDGVRGFHLARAFAGIDPPGKTQARAGGTSIRAVAEMLRASIADMLRPGAHALPKPQDSGTRLFRSAIIPAGIVQSAVRKSAVGRADLLACAFAEGIARTAGARAVRLMVPRDVGSGVGGGNAFLPELRNFRLGTAGGIRSASLPRTLETRAAADRLRMSILARLPVPLAANGYHRWANSFDALCTILPNLFTNASIAGSRVISAFGVPPLIWRQPLSAAMITGRRDTSLFLASDPAAIDSADILAETLRVIEAMA